MKAPICRVKQIATCAGREFLKFRKPVLLEGNGIIKRLPDFIKDNYSLMKILIVTGPHVYGEGLLNDLLEGLERRKIEYVIFNETENNPTISTVKKIAQLYKDKKCQGFISFGGGSPMDAAKAAAAALTQTEINLRKLEGNMKVRKDIVPLFAVPTTAGTGSEATIAAVVTDGDESRKYSINDTHLIPQAAVLDPNLTINLSPELTAETGMDALTHAIEAYINIFSNNTKPESVEAVRLIFDNLKKCYDDGQNSEARKEMLRASYLAGVSFTRSGVGYVHAISHALSGLYGLPHGRTNAIILPIVLRAYGSRVTKSLSNLATDADALKDISNSQKTNREQFIESIERMNEEMGIPKKIDCIKEEDIPIIVKRAISETQRTYPVPEIWNEKKMTAVINSIRK